MHEPLVSVQVVVRNGERYLRQCLDSVRAQTYKNLEVVVLDNHSSDNTTHIIETDYPEFTFIRSPENLGMWPGHEFLMQRTHGKYIVGLSIDVVMDSRFIEEAMRACENDAHIAAVQGKTYQYEPGKPLERTRIDTCGFALARSRKVINIGHGEMDRGQLDRVCTIFGVEGAVPFFRRSALEDCRVNGRIWDPDYFWYGDDLDLAWRMTLFGHRQMFIPTAVAWHDRSTTKGAEHTGRLAQNVARRTFRQNIPIKKRRLDWSNTRFTIIKNDYLKNILRDLPAIVFREINVQGYAGLFEQQVLLEWGRFFRLIPRMLMRRRDIMARARFPANQLRNLMIVNTTKPGAALPGEVWWQTLRITVITLGFVIVACLIVFLIKFL